MFAMYNRMMERPYYAIPLPKEHEHHYVESDDGPRYGPDVVEKLKNKKIHPDVNYLLDKDNKIVGFTFEGVKFILSNVIHDSGKILPTAKFEIERNQIDQAIEDYKFYYKNNKNDGSMNILNKPLSHSFSISNTKPLVLPKMDEFIEIPGKKYGMGGRVYRGATFLENKDRGLIGFRYHGKDFFIDEDRGKVLKRYVPEMAFKHHDREVVEQFVDKYLNVTNLGLNDKPFSTEIKKTKDMLQQEVVDLHESHKEISAKKKEIDDILANIQKQGDINNIKHLKQKFDINSMQKNALENTQKDIENRLRNAENDIEALSKFSSESKEISSQEERLSELKQQSKDILHSVSETDDVKTLYKQYQKLKDIDNEIESLEKSIKEDKEFEIIDNPDDEFEIIEHEDIADYTDW